MRWADGFIAVDWGTTNRRAYLVDARGECAREFEDEKGILSVPAGGFEAAVAEVRERLGDGPMLLAGMIGSNRGWAEAPYAPCPAGVGELASALLWRDERTAIVPGVSFLDADRADVMRGEEVQLVGAVADGTIPAVCYVCHPGTHNKWVRMEGGRIAEFRTVMTGEIFNLLRRHSILSDALEDEAMLDAPFLKGARLGLAGGTVTSDLFSVRASMLLGRLAREDAVSFTSGLLIGHDVRAGLAQASGQRVIVMGRPELTRLYAMALAEARAEAEELDGERAFLAGARKIVELIE